MLIADHIIITKLFRQFEGVFNFKSHLRVRFVYNYITRQTEFFIPRTVYHDAGPAELFMSSSHLSDNWNADQIIGFDWPNGKFQLMKHIFLFIKTARRIFF